MPRADIDLIRLDKARPLLAWQVVKHGILLVGEDRRFAHYQATIALEHADAAPLMEEAARHYARCVAEFGILS